MTTPIEYFRRLALECRERANLRSGHKDREFMLGVAAEFDKLAAEAEREAGADAQKHAKRD